jgi:hypothetical protein
VGSETERDGHEIVDINVHNKVEYKIIELFLEPQYNPELLFPETFRWKIREWSDLYPAAKDENDTSFYLKENSEKDKKSSFLGLQGILNAYGKAGWELVFDPFLQEKPEISQMNQVYRIILKRIRT